MQDKRCITAQSDLSFTLETQHPCFPEARDLLMSFAELVKCPEYLHHYQITRLSLWNAASLGLSTDSLLSRLQAFLKYPLPRSVSTFIVDSMALWGLLRLTRQEDDFYLTVQEPQLLTYVLGESKVREALLDPFSEELHVDSAVHLRVDPLKRGALKIALMKIGLPVEDIAGYCNGEKCQISLNPCLQLRAYQKEAVEAFYRENSLLGGSGVIVLPCGAGKTVVGLAVMAKLKMNTLILATNTTAIRQWKKELLDKTDLTEEEIGEYSASKKDVCPVTLATYQILTSRARKTSPFRHFGLFDARDWGLIIYDEVHLLPAPLFQVTASLQSRRRLGLTATLVREDNKEADVFSLIGPKKYEVPWKVLESQGWIAQARCIEVSVPFALVHSPEYREAKSREQFRIAACNPEKISALCNLVKENEGKAILVLGMFLDQLRAIAEKLDAPLIEGRTPQKLREKFFSLFQEGQISLLVLSKVGNSSIDLPDAEVAIQVSGTFGSRQEEAQRLGRILRPKSGSNQAFFYSLISNSSRELDFSLNRQRYLVEQGYDYQFREIK